MKKLQGESDLLDYIIDVRDVPVSELETNFGDLIAEQENAEVDLLLEDSGKYLQEHVRVGVIPLGDGRFDISGNIDNNTLETIKLLTNQSDEDIVQALLDNVLNELRGDREASVDSLELKESDPSMVVPQALESVDVDTQDVIDNLVSDEDFEHVAVAPEVVSDDSVQDLHDDSELIDEPLELSVEDFPPLLGEEVNQDPEVGAEDDDALDFDPDSYVDDAFSGGHEASSDSYDYNDDEDDVHYADYVEDEYMDDDVDLDVDHEVDQVSPEDAVEEEARHIVANIFKSFVQDLRSRELNTRLHLNLA